VPSGSGTDLDPIEHGDRSTVNGQRSAAGGVRTPIDAATHVGIGARQSDRFQTLKRGSSVDSIVGLRSKTISPRYLSLSRLNLSISCYILIHQVSGLAESHLKCLFIYCSHLMAANAEKRRISRNIPSGYADMKGIGRR